MAYSSKDKLLELAMQNQSSQNNALLNRGGGRFNNLLGIISSVASQTANPNTEMGSILGTAGRTYLGNLQSMNENNFLRDVQTIHFSQSDPQTKLQALMGTLAKYGQDPKNYADVLEMYSKQIEATQKQMMNPLQQAQTQYYQARANQQPALSPSLQKVKDTKTADIIDLISINSEKREAMQQALDAAKGLKGGILGKVRRDVMSNIDPNNPELGEWQKIKIVLTDAQLLNTAKTKGAISDREMDLFAKAAANDDLTSLPRISVVIDRMMKKLSLAEKSAVSAYQRIYKESPYDWDEVKGVVGSNRSTAGSALDLSKLSDDELKKIAGI